MCTYKNLKIVGFTLTTTIWSFHSFAHLLKKNGFNSFKSLHTIFKELFHRFIIFSFQPTKQIVLVCDAKNSKLCSINWQIFHAEKTIKPKTWLYWIWSVRNKVMVLYVNLFPATLMNEPWALNLISWKKKWKKNKYNVV